VLAEVITASYDVGRFAEPLCGSLWSSPSPLQSKRLFLGGWELLDHLIAGWYVCVAPTRLRQAAANSPWGSRQTTQRKARSLSSLN